MGSRPRTLTPQKAKAWTVFRRRDLINSATYHRHVRQDMIPKIFQLDLARAKSLMTLGKEVSGGEMEEKADCQRLRGKRSEEMEMVRLICTLE